MESTTQTQALGNIVFYFRDQVFFKNHKEQPLGSKFNRLSGFRNIGIFKNIKVLIAYKFSRVSKSSSTANSSISISEFPKVIIKDVRNEVRGIRILEGYKISRVSKSSKIVKPNTSTLEFQESNNQRH